MKNLSIIAFIGATLMIVGCTKDDGASGNSKDISTKIEDTNLRKFCIQNFDLNKDGRISKDEAAMVETINVDSQNNIYSINGIDIFPNLANLLVENQKLETVDISDINLSYFSFKDCKNLKGVNLNGNTASIGNCAFDGCTNLKDVVIPETVTTIGYIAFCKCTNIKNIRIPDNVRLIEGSSFYGCTGLTKITIPDSTTSLGDYAFYYCTNLSDITLGNNIRNIGHSALAGCRGLNNITIPSSVVNIEGGAFAECSFTEVNIPNGVKSIGNGVFSFCNNLNSVTIPDSITSIIGDLFSGCNNIVNVYFLSIEKWCEIDFASPTLNNHTNLYLNGELVAGDLVIPDGVTSIGQYAFSGCTNISNIVIPDGVTSIGNSAFSDCKNLTTIYCKPTTPPTLGSNALYDISSDAKIYVPRNSVSSYKTASGWSSYANKIEGYDF